MPPKNYACDIWHIGLTDQTHVFVLFLQIVVYLYIGTLSNSKKYNSDFHRAIKMLKKYTQIHYAN